MQNWAVIVRWWQVVKKFLLRWWGVLSGVAILLAFVALVLISFSALCLNVIQINLDLGRGTTGLCVPYAHGVMWLLGLDAGSLDPVAYKRVITHVLTIQMTLLSVYLVVVPILGYMQHRRKLTRSGSLRRERVFSDGVDDLNIMLKAYRSAERITVFSGDFSWLKESDELREKVCALAGQAKVNLISYKTPVEIQRALNDPGLFNRLKPAFLIVKGTPLKCSLVEYSGANATFLYKDRGGEFGQDPFVVIARYSDESRGLLKALREMIAKITATGQRIP